MAKFWVPWRRLGNSKFQVTVSVRPCWWRQADSQRTVAEWDPDSVTIGAQNGTNRRPCHTVYTNFKWSTLWIKEPNYGSRYSDCTTGWTVLGSNPCRDKRLLSFCTTSRTDAGATQPPMRPVMAVLSGGKVDSLLSRTDVKNECVSLSVQFCWRTGGAYFTCCNLYRCVEMCLRNSTSQENTRPSYYIAATWRISQWSTNVVWWMRQEIHTVLQWNMLETSHIRYT